MAGAVQEIGDEDFDRVVLQADRPVLVTFTAPWCGPCRAMAPALEALAVKYRGRVGVAELDAGVHQAAAERYGVRATPTLLLFRGGRVLRQLVGLVARPKLEALLEEALG